MDSIDPAVRREFKKEDLVYTSDSKPGIFRQKYGRKFQFYDSNGHRIRDKKTLLRIKSLVIPPAWKEVWISPKVNGHLQATGIDDRKRKQYLYHPDWIRISQKNKFAKLREFGLTIPKIRQKIQSDLRSDELDKKKVLATIVWLLEKTFVRIGNEEYKKENNSFGLTTLRNRHVKVRGSDIVFRFRGKSGVENVIEISNPTVAKTLKECIELPGYELFRYIDENNDVQVVDSEDVNLFLKEVSGDDFSAKDFRTWGATSLCATTLFRMGEPEDEELIKKNIIETVKTVADELNNTVSVCKSYYIHPTVIDTYSKKKLVDHFSEYSKNRRNRRGLAWDEWALVKLLEKHPLSSSSQI